MAAATCRLRSLHLRKAALAAVARRAYVLACTCWLPYAGGTTFGGSCRVVGKGGATRLRRASAKVRGRETAPCLV